MGYMIAMSDCFVCRRIFSYNPNTVPSIRDSHDVRQPICAGCMLIINTKREAQGLPAFPIRPDAYEAAEDGFDE